MFKSIIFSPSSLSANDFSSYFTEKHEGSHPDVGHRPAPVPLTLLTPLPRGGQAPYFRSGPIPSLVLGDIALAFLPFLLAGSSPSEYNMPLHHPSIKKRENPLLTHIPVWLCPVPLLPTSAELLGGQLSGFRTCPSVETALLVAAGE